MAYPPHDWTAEAPFALTGPLMDTLEFRGKPKAKITYPTVQSIPDSTDTVLTNNASTPTTIYDTDSMVDAANRRIKITTPGWYVPLGVYAAAGNGTGVRKARLRLNGTTIETVYVEPDASTPCLIQVTSAPILCAANDYFQVVAYQGSGGALNTYNSTEGVSSLAVYMVDTATS